MYHFGEPPYNEKDFLVWIKNLNSYVPEIFTFKHCNLPLAGVGPQGSPYIDLTSMIDTSLLGEIYKEVCSGVENQHNFFRKIVQNGITPAWINNGDKSVDSYLLHLDKYAPQNDWKSQIADLKTKREIKIFFHRYFSIKEGWEGIAQFRVYDGNYENKSKPSSWLPLIKHFPILKKFVEGLPFEHIGYAMIFKSLKNAPVLIHRDYFPINHSAQFINFYLDPKPKARPAFLYDIETQKKTYLPQSCRAYYFNEIDFHGIDPEPESRLTLRIEGKFTKDFLAKIGLFDKRTFDWNYDKPKKYVESGQFKIEQNTDI
jgi:hypothetical protein